MHAYSCVFSFGELWIESECFLVDLHTSLLSLSLSLAVT